jgi:SAM-dependent methyltransferase
VRQFSADYLRDTREGMWADSRDALAPLGLDRWERVLDVGCGTGELTRVLAEQTGGDVVGVDADPDLLSVARDHVPVAAGDATRLPFADDSFDLVVCQALLINLPDPAAAVREFARVARHRVAAVEPDNAAVTVESSVDAEARLARRARRAYVSGVDTDVTLGGAGTRAAFEDADIADPTTRRYDHDRVVEPPYSERDIDAAKRKATGGALADDRPTMLAGDLTESEYDALRGEWREMGRAVVRQMADGEYCRREVVPFYVTVGSVE